MEKGSTNRAAPRARRLAVAGALLTALACLAILEGGLAIAARVTDSPILQPWGVESARVIAAYKLEPGHRHQEIPANARGYHDRDWSAEIPLDTFRVVSLGDSFALGAGVRFADNYNTLLEEPAASGRPAIEVLNHGVAATGPPEYLWIYRTEVAALDHDALMISVFLGNDLSHRNEPPDRRELDGWYTWLALSRLAKIAALEETRETRSAPVPFTAESYRDQGLWKTRLFLLEEKRHRERRAQRALDLLEEIVASSSRPVVIAILPDEIQVNDAFRDEVFTHFDLDPDDFDFGKPTRRIEALAARHPHATAVDLTPALQRAEAEAPTYLHRDTHWNARGHRVAAETLRPVLRRLARAHSGPR